MRRILLFLLQVGAATAQLEPLTVSKATVDGLSHSSLRLTWNNSAPINAIRVRYGFTTAYELGPPGGDIFTPGTFIFSQFGQTASISGLKPDTLYHFCPQASVDGGTTWSACVDAVFTTLPLPAVHPEPPQPVAEIDISYPDQTGASLLVSKDCSNLQALMNQARYGDTILIPAGTTCPDSYTLPPAPEALTFLSANVNLATDRITLASHGFDDRQKVHLDTDGCLPGSAGQDIFCQSRGIFPGSDYFVRKIDANTFQLVNSAGELVTFSVASFTADPNLGTLTLPAGKSLLDGAAIRVRSTGTLPSGLDPQTTYYAVNPAHSQSIRLALAEGGPPIQIGSTGSGIHSFVDAGYGVHSIMAWPPANRWIVVRTATPDDQFCPEGVRCLGEIWGSKMARIAQMTPPTGNFFLDMRLGTGILSHNWRFVGIEFTHADNSAAAKTSTDPTPYFGFINTRRSNGNIILDRCYIHGLGFPNRLYRAIEAFDGENMAIINSDLEKLDYWHPAVTPNGLTPAMPDSRTITISPGTYYMGVSKAVADSPVTITLTSFSGSGTAIVYFDLAGTLHVDLPAGVQATCSRVPCIVTTTATNSPSYPNDAHGRISAAQITDLTIVNGAFTAFTNYRTIYPQSVNANEGAQSFIAGNGPGPILLQNNTISGTGIPVHFDEGLSYPDRHDYIVRRNLFTAPLSQSGGGPGSDGLHYFHRNFLEWKGGQRILVDGNVFEHNFQDATPLGSPLVFTPRSGGYTTDVTVSNNTFRNNGAGLILAAADSYNPASKPIERVAVVNNLFHHNNGYTFAAPYSRGTGAGFQIYYAYAAADLSIDHNTMYDNEGLDAVPLHLGYNPMEGTSITNNFLWVNEDGSRKGIDSDSYPRCSGAAKQVMDCFFVSGGKSAYTFTHNVFLPGWYTSPTVHTKLLNPAMYRDAYADLPENWVVNGETIDDRLAQSGWASAELDNYRLSAESPYAAGRANASTDGKAVGADIDQLERAQGIIGTPSSSPASPTSVIVSVTVPDPGAACWVFYGKRADLTTFSRTAADTTQNRMRSIAIEDLTEGVPYSYVVLCSGSSNSPSGRFKTTSNPAPPKRR